MKTIIHNEIHDSSLRIAMLGKVIDNGMDDGKMAIPLHLFDVMDLGWACEYVKENGGAVTFADMDGVKA